jgi:hypothetical protein
LYLLSAYLADYAAFSDMGILNGHIGVLDGPGDLAVADFRQEVLAVVAAASAEGEHPADGKSGFRKNRG